MKLKIVKIKGYPGYSQNTIITLNSVIFAIIVLGYYFGEATYITLKCVIQFEPVPDTAPDINPFECAGFNKRKPIFPFSY